MFQWRTVKDLKISGKDPLVPCVVGGRVVEPGDRAVRGANTTSPQPPRGPRSYGQFPANPGASPGPWGACVSVCVSTTRKCRGCTPRDNTQGRGCERVGSASASLSSGRVIPSGAPCSLQPPLRGPSAWYLAHYPLSVAFLPSLPHPFSLGFLRWPSKWIH